MNAADLVIVRRHNSSSQFQDGNGEIWNLQVTAPVMAMSAYIVRDNRMRWVTGSNLADSDATILKASQPGHPVFEGITLSPDSSTIDDYNVKIDQGISTNLDEPVGGSVIAWNPSVSNGGTMGVAIAEWPAGTVVGGGMELAGYRMLFNGGSRELGGQPIDAAGVLDLTPLGQELFLNAVNYAAVPEPSSALLGLIGLVGLACVVDAEIRLTKAVCDDLSWASAAGWAPFSFAADCRASSVVCCLSNVELSDEIRRVLMTTVERQHLVQAGSGRVDVAKTTVCESNQQMVFGVTMSLKVLVEDQQVR